MNHRMFTWSGLTGVSLFIGSVILGGLSLDNYSHVSQFISESYAIGTPFGEHLRFFGFIPGGFMLAVFGFASMVHFEKRTARIGFAGLAIFYGIGTVVVSIFPCDEGCNKQLLDPTVSQLIHNIVGSLTYMVTPICFLLIGIGLKRVDTTLSVSAFIVAIVTFVFMLVLSNPSAAGYAGLYQRIIEGSILLWIAGCSWVLRKGVTPALSAP